MTLDNLEILRRLGVALAVGLLIGLERGWEMREIPEKRTLAGFRTFGIVSLLGGIAAVAVPDSLVLPAAVFLVVGLVAAAGYWQVSVQSEDLGGTTVFTLLLAYGLGAVAGRGQLAPAAATSVIVTLLLGTKPELHAAVQRLDRAELLATIRLLLISIVMLPVLPDRGFGPWEAVNPYRIWWMVVLVAGLSYLGYFAIKLMGDRLGLLVTGLLGGLASSVATALELAPQGKANPRLQGLAVGAIVVASSVMFPRMLAVSAINPSLLPNLAAPLLAAGIAGLALGALLLRSPQENQEPEERPELKTHNPLDLRTSLRFGLILTVIMILARGAVALAGSQGVYVISALSGLADVDAITLSLASMASRRQAPIPAAIGGILIAATVNTFVKPALVLFSGNARMAWNAMWPLALAVAAGGAGLFLSRYLF